MSSVLRRCNFVFKVVNQRLTPTYGQLNLLNAENLQKCGLFRHGLGYERYLTLFVLRPLMGYLTLSKMMRRVLSLIRVLQNPPQS